MYKTIKENKIESGKLIETTNAERIFPIKTSKTIITNINPLITA